MNDEKIMPNPQFPYEETLKYIKLEGHIFQKLVI